MSYFFEAIAISPKDKPFMRKILAVFVSMSMLVTLLAPLGVLLPVYTADAAAPTFLADNMKWKSTSANVLIDFTQPVFNSSTKVWGPQGKLEAADFVIAGAGAPALSSVTHDGGSRYAVLTFASAPSSTTTIACAATSIYDEGFNSAAAACDSAMTPIALSAVTEDTTAPTITSVMMWSNNGLEVRYSEQVSQATAGSRANYKLTTASATDAYTGAATMLAQDGTTQDVFVWVQQWDQSVVMFDIWDATIAGGDTLTITTGITDLFGNALAVESDQALNFSAGGSTAAASKSPEVLGAFFVNGTTLDVVFSKVMDEASAETAAFYTVIDSAGTSSTADHTTLTIVSATQQSDTKIIRLVVSGGTILATDFQTNPNATPDTVKVCTSFCANGGPKDTSFNTQMTEYYLTIEPAISGLNKIKTISVGTNGNVRIFVETVVDVGTINASDFTFKRDGSAIASLVVNGTSLDWDNHTITLNTSGAAIDDSNTGTAETLEINVTNNTGIAHI